MKEYQSRKAIQLHAIAVRFLMSCSLDPMLRISTVRYVKDSTSSTLSPAMDTREPRMKEASVVWILVFIQLTWRPRDLAEIDNLNSAKTKYSANVSTWNSAEAAAEAETESGHEQSITLQSTIQFYDFLRLRWQAVLCSGLFWHNLLNLLPRGVTLASKDTFGNYHR